MTVRFGASPGIMVDGGTAVSTRGTALGGNTDVATAGESRADAAVGLAPQPGGDAGEASVAGSPSDAALGRRDLHDGGVCDGVAFANSNLPTGAACPEDTRDACGGGRIVGSCGWDNHDCNKGTIWESTSERLDCEATALFAPTQAGAPWDDCDAALRDGRTGEACAWTGSCTRATDDPCCIETASCGLLHQEQRLYRYRVCTPGCQGVRADTTQAKVVRCAGADMIRKLGAPCEPGLVCIAGGAPADTGALSYYASSVFFCADGMLVGNPNAFLPFL